MSKIRNKLYSNPSNAREINIGDKFIIEQPIKINNKKVMVDCSSILSTEILFINFARNSENKAKLLLNEINEKINKSNEDLPCIGSDEKIKEFLFYSFSCVIYSYCAIEIYLNNYLNKNNLSLGDKPRYSLQEKIEFICNILEIKKISKDDWNIFLELENMRDTIIHGKQEYYIITSTSWSDGIISKMLNGKFLGKMKLSSDIIEYFKRNIPRNIGGSIEVERGLQSNPIK